MWKRWSFKPHSEPQALRTSADEEALAEYVYSKVIYQAGVDFESKPMVVICACNLPNPADVDYDRILSRILQKLDIFVESDYTVVLFAGGAKYNPGWAWMFRAYKSLSRNYKKNLKSLYIVQPTTWARLYLDFMNVVISPKFAKKVKYVLTLSELARYVPLTQIDIPPAVYEYNLKFEDRIKLPNSRNYDEDGHLMFGVPIEQLMGTEGENGLPRVVKDCVTFIRSEGLETEGVFRRSPSSVLLRQAKEAYDRGNPVNLKDYGVHVAAVLLKMFFNALPVPVFPVETYDILKQIVHKSNYLGRVEFIRSSVFPLLSPAVVLVLRYVCALLVEISKHKNINLMTPHNLAVMFAPNLVHSGNPLLDVSMCALNVNDNINGGGVGILMKLAIEHFDIMFEGYEDLSIRNRIENGSISTSSSIIESPETPSIINTSVFFANPSTPPKYPSVKKMRSLAALTTLTNDPFRVGAGVEISGIKVQGTVTLNQLNTKYSDIPGSPKTVNELRRTMPWMG
ncbi:Rho GTPase activation protein [Gigaspora margarita]|uniref:Rho GTPase activation protein n=1 Tax=Gigaspora margarita TaxID=4874 RepID=A0A8H3XE92_GIGMA|nr:Rho GTPase activation protein [Gigaspora margarita]